MIANYQYAEKYASPATQLSGRRSQVVIAFGFMIIIPALAIAAGQAGVLRIAFPLLSVFVGAFLLWRSVPAYVELVFWLWFLSPFLGRIAGFQGGWTPNNPVEVAPYITAGLAGLPILASIRSLGEKRSLPYTCAIIAIAYGLVLGLATLPLFNVLRALLNWLVPVLFGLFIYENRDKYVELKEVVERSFLYGTLLTGAYGIYQFFGLPDWDRMWMLNVQLNSFGAVDAMKIRAFSTMNAPAIFAAVTTCGLLFLSNIKSRLRLLATGCGFIALMLTVSRSAWLSLAIGGAYLLLRAEYRYRMRLTLALMACGIAFIGISQVPVIHDLLSDRFESFSAPGEDISFAARLGGHEDAFRQIAQEPFGEGIGSTDTYHNTEGDDDIIGPHDSTVLEFLYSLGWMGSFVYLIGLINLVYQVMRVKAQDSFVTSAKAALIGLAAQCLLNSVMIGVLGFMVWTCASMCLIASEQANYAQRTGTPGSKESTNVCAA